MSDPAPPGGAVDATLSPASLLQLIWLASPALPVGGFSYSEVLEAAVDRAGVTTEATAVAYPHTAIRESASINLEAIDRMLEEFPTPTSCSSNPAVTTWRPPSARNSATSPST